VRVGERRRLPACSGPVASAPGRPPPRSCVAPYGRLPLAGLGGDYTGGALSYGKLGGTLIPRSAPKRTPRSGPVVGRARPGMPVGDLRRAHVMCPICDHVFRATYASTYVTVGREADLCPKIPGRPSDGARLIRSAVTMCPACSFRRRRGLLRPRPDLRRALRHRRAPEEDGLLKVFRKAQPPWLAFHAAEVCGKERGLKPQGARRPLPARLLGVPQGTGAPLREHLPAAGRPPLPPLPPGRGPRRAASSP
jgi:hypothetical protein